MVGTPALRYVLSSIMMMADVESRSFACSATDIVEWDTLRSVRFAILECARVLADRSQHVSYKDWTQLTRCSIDQE